MIETLALLSMGTMLRVQATYTTVRVLKNGEEVMMSFGEARKVAEAITKAIARAEEERAAQ